MEITAKVVSERTNNSQEKESNEGWEVAYYQYLAEKEAAERLKTSGNKCVAAGSTTCKDEDWAIQYAEYCTEKEKRLDEEERRRKRKEQQMQ